MNEKQMKQDLEDLRLTMVYGTSSRAMEKLQEIQEKLNGCAKSTPKKSTNEQWQVKRYGPFDLEKDADGHVRVKDYSTVAPNDNFYNDEGVLNSTSAQPFTVDCYICGKPITEFITIGQRAHVECAGNEVVKEVEADDDE